MTPIPVEVRRRIIALYERGKETGAIADALGHCVAAVRRVRQHLRERGTLDPATHRCGRRGRFTPEVRAELARLHGARPDATLAELADGLASGPLALAVAPSTVDRWMRGHLGVAQKKSAHAAEQGRPDVAAAQAAWPQTVAAACGSGGVTKLVFLDERARPRRPWPGPTPAAPGASGPWPPSSPATGGCSRCSGPSPSAAAGATVLYLPPYSPDLNPIKRVWAKVKALLRSAAARTIPDLHAAIGRAFEQVTLDDLLGCFADCGYKHATRFCEML